MIDIENSPQPNDSTSVDDQRILDAIEEARYLIANSIRSRKIAPEIMLKALTFALEHVDRFSQNGLQVAEVSITDLLTGYWTQVEKRKACAPTGFRTLNDVLGGGFESKRLVVVLGAPNSGKTTLVHQMADHMADNGYPVLYVTS